MCGALIIDFRDRVLTPAVTLGLFVSQVLSRGDACITVMAKFNRERKDRGLPPVAEDASAYTKVRARLPVVLINHLIDRVRKMAHKMTPDEWKWNGLNVYLVDGFVLRAPATLANQKKYPQPSSQKEGAWFSSSACRDNNVARWWLRGALHHRPSGRKENWRSVTFPRKTQGF